MPHMDVSVVVVGDSYSSAEKNRYKHTNEAGEPEGLSSWIRSIIE